MLEPLLDRIEVIKIDDYTFKEKRDISEQFIIPSVCKEFGFTQSNNNDKFKFNSENGQSITIPEEAISTVIKEYSFMGTGMRGIRRTFEKLIRKININLMEDNIVTNFTVDDSVLKTFLSDRNRVDTNFRKMMSNYREPGSVIVADQSGYISKVIMRQKDIPNSQIDSKVTNNILRTVEVFGKLDKPVEESFKVALHLVRDKIIDLYNKDLIKDKTDSIFNDYNIWISTPSHKKKGNAYGLAFYIVMLSGALKVELPTAGLLAVGELSPHGNVLKIYDLNHTLTQCEFYDINTLILPEGNRAEYNQIVQRNDKKYKVHFVKSAQEAFDLLFEKYIGRETQGRTDFSLGNTESRRYHHLI